MEKGPDKLSLSVIIPALNEAKNLPATVEEVCRGLNGKFSDYEILVFDDCSTDDTFEVANHLAKQNNNIKVYRNLVTKGFGYNYKKGVELAKNEYIVMFPGDNAFPRESISELLSLAGAADIIIPYTKNPWVRPFSRRVISRAFVGLINLLFGLKIKYYNGTVLHKREILKRIQINTSGFAYQAAILVKLIRSGCSYKEVGMKLVEREYGGSKAFRLRNVISVIKTIANLFWEVGIKKRVNI